MDWNTARIRYAYMDAVTRRVEKSFHCRLASGAAVTASTILDI
jgi:hypothetical protein